MKKARSVFTRIFSAWQPFSEWPFMLFLTFVFVFIYIWTVISSTRLRDPLILAAFTVLFNIHLGLHWISIWWLQKKWNPWLYLGIQAAIAFTLVSVAGEIGALLGLYMGLVGEAVGIFSGSWRGRAAGIACILTLSALNYFWISRGENLFWWALAILPMTFFVVIYVLLYTRQADARVKAQELLAKLEVANRRLTEYADQIEDLTLANERQRMARELHDTLAQGLAGLILQLEAADSHLAGGRPDRAQTIVQQAMTRARGTLAESRRAIGGLRAQVSRQFDDALREEVDHFIATAGIPCTLDLALAGPLPDSIKEFALRAVSECLANIARHAHAAHAAVTLRSAEASFAMEVRDDGIGFAAGEEERAGHYGLIGLRERVRLSGGAMEIRSTEGKGTILNVTIPLDDQG